jgi:phage shock protein B
MDMSTGVFVLAIVFLVVVMPFIVILHYVTKWKATRGLSSDEQRMLEELWKTSQAMDSRLNALETILRDDAPEWKKQV